MTLLRSNRREFLKSSTGLSAGLGLAALSASRVAGAERKPLYRIALAESSLRSSIPAGRLDHLDFPEFARRRFGIEAVEYWSPLFKKHAKDLEYLKQTALTMERAKKLGPFKKKRRLVFAPTKYLDQDRLDALRIDFAQLPFEIYKLAK